jgi:RimJ/RimL family protein N-acetyltransferase
VNDPAWLRHIGDKGVRTPGDALAYIANGPMASYLRHGFGLDLVELKVDTTPIGICGLIKRDPLMDADIGFAFLPQFRGTGYAFESAVAVMRDAQESLALKRIAAIVCRRTTTIRSACWKNSACGSRRWSA